MSPARMPGMVVTDHTFSLPLDHAEPNDETIEVFAREVVAPGRENEKLPFLVFLQGGPGHESPRPPGSASWLPRALRDYRVLLLDQRGTGRSTRLQARTLAAHAPQEQARRLGLHRMDAIVSDCEAIRKELCGDEPWTVLGQSYGGFCATHYLSAAPEGLAAALITGGLPPLTAHPDDIYRQTYVRCRERNAAYYERYPDDVHAVRTIIDHLAENQVELPSGDPLTPRRFQLLGLALGMSDGFESIHYLVEDAFITGPKGPELGFHFLAGVEHAQNYSTNPLFSLLHEPIYCQGFASNWSAERIRGEFPEFDPLRTDGPALFTGEMIYPWMFEDFEQISPLRDAAHLLAARSDWSTLYDPGRLEQNNVPVAAALYVNDMYVDRSFSLETADTIRGARVWVTTEYEHNGLRADGERVLDRLLAMAGGDA
ncbi:MAG: alpha/beta fold hydrolase [Actinobacteria bacterium]|nr:alpha/beta fold hydrolase [Actinomycetota bacterium]